MKASQTPQACPYRLGHKIRILFGKGEGDHTVTFGEVVEVSPNNIPTVRYRDYSGIKLGEFNRIVKSDEVEMIGKFTKTIWEY